MCAIHSQIGNAIDSVSDTVEQHLVQKHHAEDVLQDHHTLLSTQDHPESRGGGGRKSIFG